MNEDEKQRLAASAEARIRARIEAERQRTEQQRDTRAAFAANRQHGIRSRHSAKAARLGLIQLHDTKEGQQ